MLSETLPTVDWGWGCSSDSERPSWFLVTESKGIVKLERTVALGSMRPRVSKALMEVSMGFSPKVSGCDYSQCPLLFRLGLRLTGMRWPGVREILPIYQ